MQTLCLTGAALALALVSACSSSGAGKITPPTEQEMMARWTAYMTPGDGHALLAKKVGSWVFTVRTFQPGSPPMESTGSSEVKWIMDGRYLEDRTASEVMGQPFQGLGYTAYDNLAQKYVSTWIDNFGTGITINAGTYDAATKTFSFRGTSPDAIRGRHVASRATERWIDDDHWVMQAFGPDYDGNEYLMMEIEYSRRKW